MATNLSPPEFHATLEFHDSEVRNVEAQASTLTIAFSAAYVRTPAQAGVEASAGYVQSLVMEFQQASWDASITNCMGRLSHGRLWMDGAAHSSIQLPFASPGPVRVELQFSNGAYLSIAAQRLVCRFTGDPQFMESLAC